MYIVEGEIHDGFELPYAKVVAVAERDVFGTQKKRLRHRVAKGQEISVFTSLKSGDYVVHEVHGIGRYMGIKTIEMDGVHKDYLEIHYAGKDILYVPTDQLSLLQRYIGNEGDTPKLQKMGGSDWQKIRSKLRNRLPIWPKNSSPSTPNVKSSRAMPSRRIRPSRKNLKKPFLMKKRKIS